jgi:hypothetical protein
MKNLGKGLAACMAFGFAFGCQEVAAQSLACTALRYSDPPPVVETSLGEDIDELAWVSNGLRSDIDGLKKKGWQFGYDSYGHVVRPLNKNDAGQLYINKTASVLTNVAELSHEVGHATYNPVYDYSSKDNFVRVACTDEAYALRSNISARDVIKSCPVETGGGVDIGLLAAQPWSQYEDYIANSLPVNMAGLGMLFCETNYASAAGQIYLDYYGDWYDKEYGNKSNVNDLIAKDDAALPKVQDSFWKELDVLSKAAWQGAEELIPKWPSKSLIEQSSQRNRELKRTRLSGGGYELGGGLVVTSSTITVNAANEIVHAGLTLEGVCIVRQDLEQHYPDLVLIQIPRIPGDPFAYSTYRSWGQLGFAFTDGSHCMKGVFFIPKPELPNNHPESEA